MVYLSNLSSMNTVLPLLPNLSTISLWAWKIASGPRFFSSIHGCVSIYTWYSNYHTTLVFKGQMRPCENKYNLFLDKCLLDHTFELYYSEGRNFYLFWYIMCSQVLRIKMWTLYQWGEKECNLFKGKNYRTYYFKITHYFHWRAQVLGKPILFYFIIFANSKTKKFREVLSLRLHLALQKSQEVKNVLPTQRISPIDAITRVKSVSFSWIWYAFHKLVEKKITFSPQRFPHLTIFWQFPWLKKMIALLNL